MASNNKNPEPKIMNAGFVQVSNKILRDILSKSNTYCAIIYILLLSHRNNKTNLCFPSRSTLANESGLSVATVDRSISTLIELGFIKKITGTSGNSNKYVFPKESGYKENSQESYNPSPIVSPMDDYENFNF